MPSFVHAAQEKEKKSYLPIQFHLVEGRRDEAVRVDEAKGREKKEGGGEKI